MVKLDIIGKFIILGKLVAGKMNVIQTTIIMRFYDHPSSKVEIKLDTFVYISIWRLNASMR